MQAWILGRAGVATMQLEGALFCDGQGTVRNVRPVKFPRHKPGQPRSQSWLVAGH